MAKRVYMTVFSTPDRPGWNDRVEIWDGDKRLWAGRGSVSPSPLAYSEYWAAQKAGLNPNRDDYTWDKQGGIIDYGTYRFKTDGFRGGSLAINDGGYVPSQKPNPRHGNKPIMNELYVHVGGYRGNPDADRGSIGCPTIHPDDIDGFRKNFDFKNGEEGELIITKPTESAPQGMGELKREETSGNRQDEERAKNYITDIVYPWG